MPTTLRFLGDVRTTKYCPLCERTYEGDERTVDKLVKLHIKKVHHAKPDVEISCQFKSHNGDMKKANAEGEAALQKLLEMKKKM